MAQVLAPRLESFGRLAPFLAQSDKRISEAVRVEVRDPSSFKGLSKNATNRRGAAPMRPA